MLNFNTLEIQSYMFQNGSKHNAVKILSSFLNSHSGVPVFNLTEDNTFDKNTESAVKSFQKHKNLIPTGRMDLKTWLAVGADMDPISINVISIFDETLRDLLQTGYRSKFPFKKYSASKASITTTSSSSFLGSYSFTYRVFVSVFAHFDWFGPLGWSKGDGKDRKFGYNPEDNYRLQSFSNRIASPGKHKFPWSVTRASNATTSVLWTPLGERIEKSEGFVTDRYGLQDFDEIYSESDTLAYDFSGNDDAFAIWGGDSLLTSDIDVHPTISLHYEPQADSKKILMSANGKITGDQFPAVECYVLDRANNAVMLGVWQVPEGAGPVISQDWWLGIEGDRKLPMIDIDVSFIVENGIFKNVIKNGRTISLDEHNKAFTNLPPIKSGKASAKPGEPIPSPHPTPTPRKN
jgi:peptidoglycan hydrolase-like protein with peptidoglycan-binding domain